MKNHNLYFFTLCYSNLVKILGSYKCNNAFNSAEIITLVDSGNISQKLEIGLLFDGNIVYCANNSILENRYAFFNGSHSNSSLNMSLSVKNVGNCYEIDWSIRSRLHDVFNSISLNGMAWYGGPELYRQHFVSTNSTGNEISNQPFLPKLLNSVLRDKLGEASRPWWFTSTGWTISVDLNASSPFNVAFRDASLSNSSLLFSFTDSHNASLQLEKGDSKVLKYEVCGYEDVESAWKESLFKLTGVRFKNSSTLPVNRTKSEEDAVKYSNIVWHMDSLLQSGMTHDR